MPSYTLIVLVLSCCLQILLAQSPSVDLQWAWLGGTKSKFDPPVYGEKGIPHAANLPSVRYGAAGWYDSDSQELWLFGGLVNAHGKTGMFSHSFIYYLSRLIH